MHETDVRRLSAWPYARACLCCGDGSGVYVRARVTMRELVFSRCRIVALKFVRSSG